MARYHDNASGFVRRVKAVRNLPPVEGLAALLRAWCHYIPEILPVARALEAAAITGDGGEAARHDRMNDLREAFRIAVDRVAQDGRLAEGWSVQTATRLGLGAQPPYDLAAPGARMRLEPSRLRRPVHSIHPGRDRDAGTRQPLSATGRPRIDGPGDHERGESSSVAARSLRL